jgi:hypothetical protein
MPANQVASNPVDVTPAGEPGEDGYGALAAKGSRVAEIADDHLVHDAVGPPLSGRQAAACLAVGINSLLSIGVLPALLGALADEHRLSAAQIGVTAMIELFAMGVVTAVMGLLRRPGRLRLIGLAASLGLALADLATLGASGVAMILARGVAGAFEGVLLWITVSMIARTATPERWAGAFFTLQTLAQLMLAILFAVWIIGVFGANGGFVALAVVAAIGALPAPFLPRGFPPLVADPAVSGAPPPRGLFALFATVILISAGGAVSVYLQPLAHQAHLSAAVARTALWTSLGAQVAGAATATLLAGRVKYFAVFVFAAAVYIVTWTGMAFDLPPWLFVVDNIASGFGGLLVGPFLVPFIIDADPSRRAAVQSGAAQLVGGAAGPLLAALVVSDAHVRGVIWLACGLLLSGLALVATLRFSGRR